MYLNQIFILPDCLYLVPGRDSELLIQQYDQFGHQSVRVAQFGENDELVCFDALESFKKQTCIGTYILTGSGTYQNNSHTHI